MCDCIIYYSPAGTGKVSPKSDAEFKQLWDLMTSYKWKLRTGTDLAEKLQAQFVEAGATNDLQVVKDFVNALPDGILI